MPRARLFAAYLQRLKNTVPGSSLPTNRYLAALLAACPFSSSG